MAFNDLGKAAYIALETFRKNGTGVITPLLVISENGKLIVRTRSHSWKVKRVRHNSRVRVAQSDGRGNPMGDWLEAQAQVLDDPEDEKKVRPQFAKKYKLRYYLFALMDSFKKASRVVIEIYPV